MIDEAHIVDSARAENVLNRLNHLLQALGTVPAQLEPTNAKTGLSVKLTGKYRIWIVEVECPSYLDYLPSVYLVEPKNLRLAHVSPFGSICINDSQGLSLDVTRQDDIIAQALFDAFKLLEHSDEDTRGDYSEFFDELEGYWSFLPNDEYGFASVDIDEKARLILGVRSKSNASLYFFYDRNTKNIPSIFDLKNQQAILGMYVHLKSGILPPAADESLTDEFLHQVLRALSPEEIKVWKHLVDNRSTKKARLAFILVSIPRKSGGYSFIGLTFHLRDGKPDNEKKPRPITLKRHTTEFMRERGGADLSLSKKHIAVLGCGSVGSEIADALASSGVGFISLVDHDIVDVDNVFRHLVGLDRIGAAKVTTVEDELVRKYPGINGTSNKEKAETWVDKGLQHNYDGIVIAIGQPVIERKLIRKFRQSGLNCPVVITWLEPMDLGCHAIGISTKGKGCLDCLYRDDEGTASLYPRTAFLAPGQAVSRNLTGCASTFIPYGAIQSRRAALLAAELMLDLVRGESAPAYRYSVGRGTLAKNLGLHTTPWFENAGRADEAEISRNLFSQPCATCRNHE